MAARRKRRDERERMEEEENDAGLKATESDMALTMFKLLSSAIRKYFLLKKD